MNNLGSLEYSQVHSHAQYNVKLSIITTLEQQKSMLRRGKYYWSPSYSIVSANKTICKLLKEPSNGYIAVIKFQEA